jgi:predicted nuclease with TOPRIM domain
MNPNKMWSTMNQNGTIFLIDTYQKYPELFDLALKHREVISLGYRVAFLLAMLLLIRGIVLSCVDPFSTSLRVKVEELENKLEEEESIYQVLYEENEELKQKLEESESRLRRSEALVSSLESRYLCCRQAAQKFIDVTPDAQS